MTWTNKVTWSEGLFLRPQLFQQQERYLENFAHKRSAPLSPFFWGFGHFLIDSESLNLGKLVLSSASGIFQDGTPFEIPGDAPSPLPLTLSPEHLEQTLYLALPIRAPNSEETTFDAASKSMARFGVVDSELRDANSIGQGPKPVQLCRLRLSLLPKNEMTSGWIGLPVAKLATLRSDGGAELAGTLIPPVNCYGASERLIQWIAQIHGTAYQRAESLAQRLCGSAGSGATQSAEVSDFLLLQILNRYEPLLAHLLKAKETNPEPVYSMLRSLNGELSTYIRTEQRRPLKFPDYDHVCPYDVFKPLVEDTREMLNNVLVRSAQSLVLVEKGHGMYLASLDPAELQAFSSLVLAVCASVPAEQLAQTFVAHAKLAASDRLPGLVRMHLPGIALRVLPVPPRQIPFNSGFVYFQVDPQGTHWEHLCKHGGIGLHVATSFPGLRMELWGIR
ncbi:type VI secretion system protein ImpJ [Oxalobacteraceae bacterium GrIS 2.11]